KRQQFLCAVVLLFVLGIVSIAGLRILRSAKSSSNLEDEVITYSVDTPSETKPGPEGGWRGAAHEPKKIVIPSIGVDGFIQKVGVDQNAEIAVPNNIHKAGWFVDSVLPGERGLSIIDGHLSGRQNDGIFKSLAKLEEG